MIEKTKLSNDPRDEKLAQFRQHAAVIANNKQLATEQFMELKEEFGLVYRQIEEKEAELQNIIGKICVSLNLMLLSFSDFQTMSLESSDG